MRVIDQLKSSRGMLEIASVSFDSAKDGAACLHFSLARSRDDAPRPASDEKPEEVGIEDLGFIEKDTVLSVAMRTGPLFGMSDVELLSDWQSAAEVARAAVVIQEVANGNKPASALVVRDADGNMRPLVRKTEVVDTHTGKAFSMYAISFAVRFDKSGGYGVRLPVMPWFRRFDAPGRHDYIFADKEGEGADSYLSVVLLSFREDITPLDFALALSCYCDDAQEARELFRQAAHFEESFGSDTCASLGHMFDAEAGGGALRSSDASVGEEDAPCLRRLVQALVSLHLESVRVDLFQSSERDDFLAFDCCLSYLWYRFARRLDHVRVGYCQQCGRAFSLAGHRGIPRRFCSESCKTTAKNERQRKLVQAIRDDFMQGIGVEEIARTRLPGYAPTPAYRKVCSALSSWVALKHRFDEALACGDDAFIERCVREGVFAADYAAKRMRRIRGERQDGGSGSGRSMRGD